MRVQTFKLLAGLLLVLGLVAFSFVNRPLEAAPPADNPGVAPPAQVQESDIDFNKSASADLVTLGQPVTFTVQIRNNSQQPITPQLTDTLPDVIEGLALQDDTITSTVGTATWANNVVSWTGTLAPGEEATLIYQAIPPSTSEAGQTLTNMALLQVGDVTLSDSASISTVAPDLGLWGSFVNFIAKSLVFFDRSLEAINIPYAFGFAIILFTLLVRAATFPLNMQQIKSSKAMQELQPQLKALQDKYKNDREKLAQEQMALYKEAGVNPLGGCLPMLVQMPIWFALYRALIQLSSEGLLSEGFFWIPSLAGPVSDWGGGIEWLYPFPPSVGWANAIAYLVMPILLVVSQMYMQKLMTPPSSDPQQAQMQNIMKFMPLMFGYFALIVPSGLTLYWFTSNLLGMAQHYFTKTQLTPAPAAAGAASAASGGAAVSASVPATSSGESKNQSNEKSKRKSRRKR